MYYNCLVNIPKNTGKISRNKRFSINSCVNSKN